MMKGVCYQFYSEICGLQEQMGVADFSRMTRSRMTRSASSSEQGDRLLPTVIGGEQSTFVPCVATICLPSITIIMACSDRNVNNSFLLSSERK